MNRRTNRRDFLKQTTLAGVGFWVAGGIANAAADPKSPNEKLNIAVIGCGGQGGGNLGAVSSENIVALCDVDEDRAKGAFNGRPKAKKYHDFRKMFDEMHKEIDAVVVSTPDHQHAIISITAMKLGKHVYCEKPLTHDVYEARLMRDTATNMKVATQMGNQGTGSNPLRRAAELIRGGVIGTVKEVHVWTNRPIWPQGIDRPKDTPPVPKTLDWDLWLGTAPERPYSPAYVPFKWRGWWDFGTGALGDMACHTMNLPFLALKLASPTSVEAESSRFNAETYQTWAKVRYEFPARGDMPPVTLTWYEGNRDGKHVLPPESLLKGQKLNDSGCLVVGDKGALYSKDDYGTSIDFVGASGKDQKSVPESLPRSPGHHREWILACKGGKPALSNFDYAGLLTETVLLGNVAIRAGKKIEWDGVNTKVTNLPDAEKYIKREYRKGWSL